MKKLKLVPALAVMMMVLALTISACSVKDKTGDDGDAKDTAYPITILIPEDGEHVDTLNKSVRKVYKNYKSGVSEEYYNKDDDYNSVPVELNWEDVDGAEEYTVSISTSKDMTDPKTFKVKKSELDVYNLDMGTRYYWNVKATGSDGDHESDTQFFETEDGPMIPTVAGVSNIRDFGGDKVAAMPAGEGDSGSTGGVVKTGMILRSGQLDDIKNSGIKYLVKTHGVKTDLDLREYGEGNAGYGSPLGDNVNYINISGVEYSEAIDSGEGKDTMGQELKVFADRDNYPIVMHCIYGRDRTGTLTFVLKALLGEGENEIMRDYELSLLSSGAYTKRSAETCIVSMKNFADKLRRYQDDESSSLQDCAMAYAKDCGLSNKEITTIQKLLIEEE